MVCWCGGFQGPLHTVFHLKPLISRVAYGPAFCCLILPPCLVFSVKMISLAVFLLWAAGAQSTTVRRQSNDTAPERVSKNAAMRIMGGFDPIYDYDPNTSIYCDWWYDNHDNSLACRDVPKTFGLTEDEWLRWNPSLKGSCNAWVPQTSWCIDAFGEPAPPAPTTTTTRTSTTRTTTTTTSRSTTTPAPTPTTPANGITTPFPIQERMVTNCNKFYYVPTGASCQSVLDTNKVSLSDFVKWNPAVGTNCNTLWANTHACVGVIGGATPTTPANGISTPTPTQDGMVSNCDRFHLVRSGDTCSTIGARNGIKASRISDWNKSVGASCTALRTGANVCTRTIGFVPSTSVSCHTASDHKTWGDNKPAALQSVVNWCDGNSSTDGSGGFATAQLKRGCYNTPFGSNRIEFVARNDFGTGTSLSIAKCEEIMRASVNRCDRGGTGTHEGWWFT